MNRKKSGKVKTAYKREYVNLGGDVDFDFAGPTIHGAAVVGYEGWLAGYQMSFDTAKSKMTQNNFAVGYKTGDFQLHTNVYVLKHHYIILSAWDQDLVYFSGEKCWCSEKLCALSSLRRQEFYCMLSLEWHITCPLIWTGTIWTVEGF